MQKIKIAESLSEIPFNENGLAEAEVNGKKICLSFHDGRFAACAGGCPHAGGRMAQGYVDAVGNIVCPLHRYKFSLANGRNTSGEGYFLKTYPAEVTAEGVFITL